MLNYVLLLKGSIFAGAARERWNERGYRGCSPSYAIRAYLTLFALHFSLKFNVDLQFKHPAMARGVKAVKAASKPSTTFFCLSNANSVFISTILQVRPSRHLFLVEPMLNRGCR